MPGEQRLPQKQKRNEYVLGVVAGSDGEKLCEAVSQYVLLIISKRVMN